MRRSPHPSPRALTRTPSLADRGTFYKEAYQSVAQQFATALKHEQQRCGYLSTEVHEVMQIREQWNTNKDRDYNRLSDSLLAVSTLCQMIRDVYHSLRNIGQVSDCLGSLCGITEANRCLSSPLW